MFETSTFLWVIYKKKISIFFVILRQRWLMLHLWYISFYNVMAKLVLGLEIQELNYTDGIFLRRMYFNKEIWNCVLLISHSVRLSLCLCICLSVCLSVCLPFSHCLSLMLFLSFSLSYLLVNLIFFLPHSLYLAISLFFFTVLSTYTYKGKKTRPVMTDCSTYKIRHQLFSSRPQMIKH